MNIRVWEPMDTAQLLNWVDEDPEMVGHMGFPEGSGKNEVFAVINGLMADPNSGIFAVESKRGLLGFVVANGVQPDGSAHVHVGINPKHRGVGGIVMRRGVRFAFESLGLKKLIAVVPPGRDDVEKLDKAIGFEEPEGKILFMTKERWDASRR